MSVFGSFFVVVDVFFGASADILLDFD